MSTPNKPPLPLPPDVADELRGAMTYTRDGTLVYGLRFGSAILYATSAGDVLSDEAAQSRYAIAAHARPTMQARISRDAIERFYDGGPMPNGFVLFSDVAALFRSHLDLPGEHTAELLAAWVMATYAFRMFAYFPYLAISSATKRSGKSLLEEIVSELAWNATQPQADPTPATLFRTIHANSCTVILDEVESLTNADKDKKAALMALLNVGFKRGGTVPRNERVGSTGKFTLVEFDVYGPKVLAGIREVADTIRSRSIPLVMRRRAPGVQLERFDVRRLADELQALRDDLHVWALRSAETIATCYAHAQTMPLPKGLDDRAKDILEPLFAVAAATGDWRVPTMLASAAREVVGAREEDERCDDDAVQAIAALGALFAARASGEVILDSDELLACFEGRVASVATIFDAQRLLRHLLAVRSRPHRVGADFKRGYKITRAQLADLEARYVPVTDDVTATEGA